MIYLNSALPTAGDVREAAIDQTKNGGDSQKAIALALIYIGQQLHGLETGGVEKALDQLGSAVERAAS